MHVHVVAGRGLDPNRPQARGLEQLGNDDARAAAIDEQDGLDGDAELDPGTDRREVADDSTVTRAEREPLEQLVSVARARARLALCRPRSG
jgi:hypothetical protein